MEGRDMGTKMSVEKRNLPRTQSVSPPKETQSPQRTSIDAGDAISKLNEYTRLWVDFEEPLHRDEEARKPLLVQSSPPDLQASSYVELELFSRKDQEPHLAEEEKLDLYEDRKKPKSPASLLRQIGSGPFRRFEYSSGAPYDDELARREFKQWIRARVDSDRFKISFRREKTSHRVAITFTPLNALVSDAKSDLKSLNRSIAQAESFMTLPVVARSTPFDDRQSILAKKPVIGKREFVFLINVPQNSKLVSAMIEITRRILGCMYYFCQAAVDKNRPAYYFELEGQKPEFAECNSGVIKDAILRSIMSEVTDLQNQDYDVHRLADDGPMLEKIAESVRAGVSSALGIEIPRSRPLT
jgi:hypothetical protein